MIGRLRKRFIRIAMLSVALVLILLSLTVNIANFVSVNSDIDSLLSMIANEQGGFGQMVPPGATEREAPITAAIKSMFPNRATAVIAQCSWTVILSSALCGWCF